MSTVNVLFWVIFVTCLTRNLTYFEGELPLVSELCFSNRNTGQVLLPPDLSDKHLTDSGAWTWGRCYRSDCSIVCAGAILEG